MAHNMIKMAVINLRFSIISEPEDRIHAFQATIFVF